VKTDDVTWADRCNRSMVSDWDPWRKWWCCVIAYLTGEYIDYGWNTSWIK